MPSRRMNVVSTLSPQFENWHQSTCRDFSTTECETINNPEFNGTVTSWTCGSLALGDITANSLDSHMPLARRASDIRRDPRDHIMICRVSQGEIGLEQTDRNVGIGPGDLALYDQAQPFKMDFVGNVRGLVAAIPRSQATERLARLEGLTARKICATSQAGRFAHAILNQLHPENGMATPGMPTGLEASALDLIFSSIDHSFADADIATETRKDKQLRDIKTFLMGNLANGDMNIDLICATQGVSPRTLNRLFSPEGTTPMRWLWQARLNAAYQEILNKRDSSITNIAYDFGFSDPSHFSKAFKRSFGVAPSSPLKNLPR